MLALYVMGYTLGRGWIEMLRIDSVELDDVAGLRFNVWTSIVLFVVAAVYFVVSQRLRPGQEAEAYVEGRGPEPLVTPPGEDAPADVTPRLDKDAHDPESTSGPGSTA